MIDVELFAIVAKATVPKLRRVLDELELMGVDAAPSTSMTASIEIDGATSRVRVAVTLEPDEKDIDW